MEDEIVVTVTAENIPNGKDVVFAKASLLYPDYAIYESICMYKSYEYTEYVFLLKRYK
jgi:hypothetical protein